MAADFKLRSSHVNTFPAETKRRFSRRSYQFTLPSSSFLDNPKHNKYNSNTFNDPEQHHEFPAGSSFLLRSPALFGWENLHVTCVKKSMQRPLDRKRLLFGLSLFETFSWSMWTCSNGVGLRYEPFFSLKNYGAVGDSTSKARME